MFIYGLISLVIGAILFAILNSLFNILYFGCFGVVATYIICVIVSMFLIPVLILILGKAFKWLLIIAIVLIIINILAKLCDYNK